MKSTFQTVLIVVFSFIGVFAVLIFSGIIPMGGSSDSYGGTVTLWGYIPESNMRSVVENFNEAYKDKIVLNYVFKEKSSLENELISALANDQGPDMLIFPQDLIVRQGSKLYPISYESYPQSAFKDSFVEVGEIFLTSNSILSLPLFIDPMVMYWNRDLFSSAGITSYPKVWVDFLALPDVLTKKDNKGNVFQSAVALGTYKNINNAKEILSTLFIQAGDSIVKMESNSDSTIADSLSVSLGSNESASQSAVHFYTEFANESRSAYSWNSSLASSRKSFESGKLAVYFGKASEYNDIKRNNPHLNFDVALMPQRDNSNLKLTYADVGGISVLKSSGNVNTAFFVADELSGYNFGKLIAEAISLPSARRDVLGETDSRPQFSVFNNSAIISRSWYDPNNVESDIIFKDMIESILSGKNTESTAIFNARNRLIEYVKK